MTRPGRGPLRRAVRLVAVAEGREALIAALLEVEQACREWRAVLAEPRDEKRSKK